MPAATEFPYGEKLKVQFSLNQVIKQEDVQATKYNQETGKYDPVFNEDGKPEMAVKSYIKLPSASQYGEYAISTEQKLKQVVDQAFDARTGKVSTQVRNQLEFDTWENKPESIFCRPVMRDENGEPLRNEKNEIITGELVTVQLTGKELVAEFDSWRNRNRTQEKTAEIEEEKEELGVMDSLDDIKKNEMKEPEQKAPGGNSREARS